MTGPFGIIKGHNSREAIALRADSNEITSGRLGDSRKHEPLGTLGLTTTRTGFGWVCLIYHQIQNRERVFSGPPNLSRPTPQRDEFDLSDYPF